jgi:outer membrane biosynthesis protein TonB
MKQLGLIRIAACATLLLAALPPRAVRADSWDRKTTITFSDTVQVPGATLPAGKYIFKLWDSPSDRYVVQIFNERQNHVFATLLTIPEYRMNAPDKTVISFYEAPAGQPQPVKAWFYPGDNNGREFIYPKAEADLIAKAAHEPIPTEQPATVALNTTPAAPQPAVASESTETEESVEEDHAAAPAPAPVAAEPEAKQESPMVDDDAEEPAPATPAAQDQPATPATDSSSMPSTGSELPLAALIGLSSIGAAISVRAIRHARRNEVV